MNFKKFGIILCFAALAAFIIGCGDGAKEKTTEAGTTEAEKTVAEGESTKAEDEEETTGIVLPEDVFDDDTTAATGDSEEATEGTGEATEGTGEAQTSAATENTSEAATEPTMASIDVSGLPTNENGAIVLPVVPIN